MNRAAPAALTAVWIILALLEFVVSSRPMEELGERHRSNHSMIGTSLLDLDFMFGSELAQTPLLNSSTHKACFFINALWSKPQYRDRSIGVAKTWGRPEFIPPDAQLMYVVGEDHGHRLNETGQEGPTTLISHDQRVVLRGKDDPSSLSYSELPARLKSTISTLNGKFSDQCSWFALADDDAYVNVTLLMEKLRDLDFQQPLMLGPVYGSHGGLFVHGDLKIFSNAAMSLVEKSMNECEVPHDGMDDAILADCVRAFQKHHTANLSEANETMSARRVVRFAHNNAQCGDEDRCFKSAVKLVTEANNPECMDVVHKVAGSRAMLAVHKFLQERPPCKMSAGELREAMDPEVLRALRPLPS